MILNDNEYILKNSSLSQRIELEIEKQRNIRNNLYNSIVNIRRIDIEYLYTIDSEKARKIIFVLLCFSNIRNHDSGWIRFDKSIRNILGMENKDFSIITKYGYEFRVYGKSSPMTVFLSPYVVEKNMGFVQEGSTNVASFSYKDSLKKYFELFGGENDSN